MSNFIIKAVIIIFTLSILSANYSYADSPKNRHSIDVQFSFLQNSKSSVEVGFGGVEVNAGNQGIGGKVTYNYFVDDEFAVNFSAGVISSSATVSNSYFNSSVNTSFVMPIMFGVKYYFTNYSDEKPVKPYLSGAGGFLFGSETETGTSKVSVSHETAANVYLGAGADFILGKLVKLNADIGYNLSSDFSEPIGARQNYGGPEFSVGLGIMF
jgi:outer membrane protein W